MGQYYYPTNLDKKEYIVSHDLQSTIKRDDGTSFTVGEGLKLMEHSYIGNPVMNAVESLLIPSGKWYKCSLVWAGDYADEEPNTATKEYPRGKNIQQIVDEEGTKLSPPFEKVGKEFKFLTNHTQRIVIDLSKVKKDSNGFKIHPLSLLVSEGNGRGGGDFHGEDSRIGTWARNVISLESEVLKGYQLLDQEDGQFVEE